MRLARRNARLTGAIQKEIMLRSIFAFCACLTLVSCATYKWQDQSFTSRQEAIAAVERSYNEILPKIQPLPKPVARYGRFVSLTDTLRLERGTVGSNMEGRSFIAETSKIGSRNLYAALVRRNIFEKLEYFEGDGSDQQVKGDEAVIYYYMPDSKTGGYYFISPALKKTPVQFDRGNPDLAGRTQYLLDSVEALASIRK